MRKTNVVLTCFALIASIQSNASDSALSSSYSFRGACGSQGVWTQTALAATQELRKITYQLKDDANCKSLGVALQSSIASMESNMNDMADSPQRAARLSQLPQEISALRNFLVSSPNMKNQVLQLMMNRSIENATLGAQVQQTAGPMASALGDFSTRMLRASTTRLQIANQVIDTIPQLEQCLTDGASQNLGNYIAASVKMLSSFVSSGQDNVGSQLAQSISKLTTMLREQKYAKVLRQLNQQEFMASMSCLMEVTTESYCQNRDAMGLFQKGMEDLRMRQDNSSARIVSQNPFAGYYILNTHVPNVTKWMQKIQIGVDPKLPTDAIFQNKIQQEVTDFYKGVKVLLGDYNTALITLKSLPSLQAKQNAILKLITQINDSMIGSKYSDEKTNFFTMSRTPVNIPFELIGIPTPDQVLGKTMPYLDYDKWLQSNMASLPIFQDPVVLSETIGRNMKGIIAEANISAIEYFNKWYIVDKSALVNESVIDINYTVKDSLVAIGQYLEQFKERLTSYKGDDSLLSAVIDTQIRINKILAVYKKVQEQGRHFSTQSDITKISEQEIDTIASAYEELINTVYTEFNVMQSRSGFLANRMVNFVYQDYVMLVKNKVNFTEYQQELFLSTGMAAFDRMLQTYNGNPANIQNDLNMGLRLNLGNIEAMETLLKDNLIGTISQLRQVEAGTSEGFIGKSRRVLRDFLTDGELSPLQDSLFSIVPKALTYWYKRSDRYSSGQKDVGIQSEFNDASYVRSQLCIQALAFINQSGLTSLCADTALKSPMTGATSSEQYNAYYTTELNRHLNEADKSPQMRTSLNRSSRICAFREFNRKNMVLFMTLGKNAQ